MIRHKGHILEFIGESYRFRQRMYMEEQQSGSFALAPLILAYASDEKEEWKPGKGCITQITSSFAFRVDLLHPRKEGVLCSVVP
jgi:hypothetical protein